MELEEIMADELPSKFTQFEQGAMSHKESIAFIQNLIDTGKAWIIGPAYFATALDCIDAGVCAVTIH